MYVMCFCFEKRFLFKHWTPRDRFAFAWRNTAPVAIAEFRFNAVLLYGYRFPVINMSIMSIRLRTGLSPTTHHLSYRALFLFTLAPCPSRGKNRHCLHPLVLSSLSLSSSSSCHYHHPFRRWQVVIPLTPELKCKFVNSCISRGLRQKKHLFWLTTNM